MSSSGSGESKGQKIVVTVRPGREYLPPKPVGGGSEQECHEEIVDREGFSAPCEKPAVGYRLDLDISGKPYPVCGKHFRALIFTPSYLSVLDDFYEREGAL